MRLMMLIVAVVLAPGMCRAAENKRPNVLFFAVDDLRTELGCYGDSYIHSPNIDRIAKRGVVFERAYCQQAVCSPSRSSLMTGTRPDTTKVWDLETHFRKAIPNVVTLGQHFKDNGYHSMGIGKIYHGGFDDEPTWSEPWQQPGGKRYLLQENLDLMARLSAEAKKEGRKGKALSRSSRGPATEMADIPNADELYTDGSCATKAVAALGRLKEMDKPFFLAVGFALPHLAFNAPKKYWDLYDPAQIKLAANPYPPKGSPDFAMTTWGELRNYSDMPQQGDLTDEQARRLKHGYYASISYMDAQVGRVLDELERLGLAENTVVVLWGDHGWKLGEHGGWCKHTNFENDANAPLLFAAPGMEGNGQRTRALVEFVDIYPSLCDVAGLSLPSHLEGHSFKPVLMDPKREWKAAAFSQYPRSSGSKALMGYTMKTDRYRFTRWQPRRDPQGKPSEVIAYELYDHQNDPAENVNVANDPANKKLIGQLDKQLNAGWKGALPK